MLSAHFRVELLWQENVDLDVNIVNKLQIDVTMVCRNKALFLDIDYHDFLYSIKSLFSNSM